MDWKRRIPEPKFLLAFPPQQFSPEETVRPEGALGLPYLDASLSQAGFESKIVDMSIGTPADRLEDTFYKKTPLESGLVRVGMSPERILEEVRDYDVVALTSIFTQQTSRCFEVAQLVKRAYPDKIVIAGGVNARNMKKHFFDHGFDVIFTSESEQAIVAFAQWLKTGSPAPAELRGLSFRDGDRIIDLPPPELAVDLDVYPMPSWHKLPNERYWEIARPFGGLDGWFEPGKKPRYASMFTSRGCPFRCTYCHISLERGGQAGDIGNLRLHSVDRFEQELHRLRDLGVELLYINDDSFLAKRARVLRVVEVLRRFDFKIADVNGVNIIHLFKRQGEKLVVDDELLEALYSAGFRRFGLPFEAGSQRMLDKYSTSKWRIAECDVETLVRKMRDIGILVDGNFIIGYPDETLEELTATFLLARRGMDAGLFGVQFFMCQPFPGTKLFAESLANGQLSQDWHWDRLGWSKGSPFTNPIVDRDTLKYCWSLVWQLLNPPTKVREIQSHMPSEMT